MADPTLQVRQAALEKLNAASIGAPVVSRIADNTEPPFVLLSSVTNEGAANKASTVWNMSIEIVTVVAARSPGPCETLMAAIVGALHDQPLPHVSATLTKPRLQSSQAEPDQERTLYIGRQTFSLTAQA
jgi:hypothetical protein